MDKKIFVTRSSLPDFKDFVEAIQPIWETHSLTNMGTYHQLLEKKLLQYLQVNNISLFVNGHMALELAIQAMDLKGEVITTPFTFASTTHAIVRNGLTPVFCDIKLDNYTIDEKKIEALITEKTSAIVAVHVYGNACAVGKIENIANKYNLKVIYDAAHAFGVKVKGEGIGNFGDASMFSFHATKVFNTIEGGAITHNSIFLGEKLYKLKNFGIKSQVSVDEIGINAKMNEIQAIMGICNLKNVNKDIEKRKTLVMRYKDNLKGIKGIYYTLEDKDIQSNYAYFPVLFDENEFGMTRDCINDVLEKRNIFARKYFYPLTNSYECYRGRFDINRTPNALYVAERILTLPLYADLQIEDVDKICDIIVNTKGK